MPTTKLTPSDTHLIAMVTKASFERKTLRAVRPHLSLAGARRLKAMVGKHKRS